MPNEFDSWIELESDPGLFTLLVEDFGVKGVQVDEVYCIDDFNSAANLQNTVYGFVFLFKWVERRRRGANIANSTSGTTVTADETVNNMFFAKQIVTNACATHALLSILLNSNESIELGPMLTEFKGQTQGMTPEEKGNAVGQSNALSWAHNKHARSDIRRQTERDAAAAAEPSRGKSTRRYRSKLEDTFHFISYVPMNGRLYELDGLKSYPIDHGEIPSGVHWTEHFKGVINERIELINSVLQDDEIRYSLMAMIPSKVDQLQGTLSMLKTNRGILYFSLKQLLQATDPKLVQAALRRLKWPENAAKVDTVDLIPSDCQDFPINETEMIEVARNLPTIQDLTVMTNQGGEMVVNEGESSEAISQSASNCPITTCEVVTIAQLLSTLEASGKTFLCNVGGKSGENSSPITRLSLSDQENVKGVVQRVPTSASLFGSGKEDTMEAQECMDQSETCSSVESKPTKSAVVVKLATTGSRGLEFIGPSGLANCVLQLEEKIEVQERLLNDELGIRQQWKIDDERRTHDYDPFIRTFLTMLVKENIIPNNPTVKTEKATKGKRGGRGGKSKR